MQDEEETFEPTPIEDIVNAIDEPEPSLDNEPEPEPEPEGKEEPKGDKPDGEEKGDKDGEPPAPKDDEFTDREKASYAKAKDEKRKRKEAQEENARLKAENESLKAPKAEPKPIPDPIDDPEGFNAHTDEKTTNAVNNESMQRLNDKFNLSEYNLRKELKNDGKDADAVIGETLDSFEDMCKTDPNLITKSRAHPHPYEFMVNTVEKSKRHAEIDDLDDWREKEKEKIRAEVLAEGESKAEEIAKAKSSIPETLGGEANQASKSGVVQTHTPIEDIVTNLEDRPVKR